MWSAIKRKPALRERFFFTNDVIDLILKLLDDFIQSFHELCSVFGVELGPDLIDFSFFLDNKLYLRKLSFKIFPQVTFKKMDMKWGIKLF
jgi:hypothetical protein